MYFKLDIGAKDLLPSAHKLKNINELDDQTTDQWEGLTTCQESESLKYRDVVMLSKERPNSSMRQFMEYMSNVHNVNSICLQCRPAESVGNCTCGIPCGCIVFKTGEQITTMLDLRMPGIVRRLPHSLCLLPCQHCLTNGCHRLDVESDGLSVCESVPCPYTCTCGETCGCIVFKTGQQITTMLARRMLARRIVEILPCQRCLRNGCHGLLHVESDRLREGEPQVEFPAAFFRYNDFCICIPVRSKNDDECTKKLITLLELQENEGRFSASSALKNYIAGSRKCDADEEYSLFWLIIVPTLTEVLIKIALTFWFKVDGFSSALVARRAMKDYLPQSDGTGFSPIAFLTAASVKSNLNNTNVCQVLRFRGSRLSLRPLYWIRGCVNLICSISWIVLVALEGGANKWYHTHSMRPFEGTIIVILVAILCDPLKVQLLDLYTLHKGRWILKEVLSRRLYFTMFYVICTVIVLEILCIVSGSVVLGILGPKVFGRWLYSALQSLVWLKWGMGTFFINQSSRLVRSKADARYIYASAFFLNAILAGVRAEWEFS